MIRGIAICGSVVEHTSDIFWCKMVLMKRAKVGSLSALYTSIQPQRAPGQGSSLDTLFMVIAGTSPIISPIGTVCFAVIDDIDIGFIGNHKKIIFSGNPDDLAGAPRPDTQSRLDYRD